MHPLPTGFTPFLRSPFFDLRASGFSPYSTGPMTPALQPRSPRPRPRRRSRVASAAVAPSRTAPPPTGSRSRPPRQRPAAASPGTPPPARSPRTAPRATPQVKVLRPQPYPDPLWLKGLTALQQTSGVVAFVVGGLAIGFYASTVHAQQQWGRAYRNLENLQRQEAQLTSAHEMLRQQFAQEAELPQSGLVPPSPDTVLFLETATPRPAPPPLPDPPVSGQSYPAGY